MRDYLRCFLAVLICIPVTVFTQSQIPLHLTSNAGALSIAEGFSLQWSLGEPIASSVSNDLALVNIGFQQNHFFNINLGTSSAFIQELEVDVYPNPSSQDLIINFEEDMDFDIKIFSISGTLMIDSIGQIGKNKIDLSKLQSGTYVLKLNSIHQQLYHQIFIKI